MLRRLALLLLGLCPCCAAPDPEGDCASEALGCWHIEVTVDEEEVLYYPWGEIPIATLGELRDLLGESLMLDVWQASEGATSCVSYEGYLDYLVVSQALSPDDWSIDLELPQRCTSVATFATIEGYDLGVDAEDVYCSGYYSTDVGVKVGDSTMVTIPLQCSWWSDEWQGD